MSTWTHNQFNIDTPFIEALNLLLWVVTGIVVLSGILALATPQLLRRRLLPLLTIITVLLFIQQNILVFQYGTLDGRNIQFDDVGIIGWVDIAMWALGLIIGVFFYKSVIKNAALILSFSGLASIAVVTISLMSYDFDTNSQTLTISEKQKFNYSKEKNVLVFLLDAFQTDLFSEIIDSEPELKDELYGFQFYPDTAAVFSKTYPTIPLLLTGKTYQKKQRIDEFLITSYQSSMLTDLIDSGWHVGLFPMVKKLVPINTSIMSNAVQSNGWYEKINSYLQTLDLSLLRSAPHWIKPAVFNEGEMLLQNPVIDYIREHEWAIDQAQETHKMPTVNTHYGLNFLANLKQFGSTSQDKPTFMFYHLLMPHRPFSLDRNLTPTRHIHDFNAYRDYAYASLKLMISYLSELKKLGIYDQSAIMILADHGGGDYFNFSYDPKTNEYQPYETFGRQISSAKSLMMIKKIHAQNTFNISPKPVSLADVMPTLAYFGDVLSDNSKLPIQKINETQFRERPYYYYQFTGFDSKYLQDFNVFNITGPVNDLSSWQHQGLLTAKIDGETDNETPYQFNEVIRFGKDLKQDADHTNRFYLNKNPTLHISSLALDQPYEFVIPLASPIKKGWAYMLELDITPGIGASVLNIEIDQIDSFQIKFGDTPKPYQVVFVADQTDLKNLTIKIANAVGEVNSNAQLSKLQLKPIHIKRLSKTNEGLFLDFAEGIDAFYAQGFRKVENWGGRWTGEKQSHVIFNGRDGFCHKKALTVNVLKFQDGVDVKQFRVYLNNQELPLIDSQIAKYHSQLTYDCSLPKNSPSHLNKLIFSTNTTASPRDISDSKDVRKLGVAIKNILIHDIKPQ